MRVWINGRNSGRQAATLVHRALLAEELGFDSLGLSDHIVEPVTVATPYPYAVGGEFPGERQGLWLDALASLAFIVASTARLEVATSVLVLPIREPLSVAKQIATIDFLAPGRIALGVGSGWLKEEFNALGADFTRRGARTDDYIALIREAWTGRVSDFIGPTYRVEGELLCEPRPVEPVPILVGGITPPALRRAGRIGDGWKGLFPSTPTLAEVRHCVSEVNDAARKAGRDPSTLRRIISLSDVAEEELLAMAARLGEISVGEVAFRANLDDRDATRQLVEALHRTEVSPEIVIEE